jgi:hypothetical protein
MNGSAEPQGWTRDQYTYKYRLGSRMQTSSFREHRRVPGVHLRGDLLVTGKP